MKKKILMGHAMHIISIKVIVYNRIRQKKKKKTFTVSFPGKTILRLKKYLTKNQEAGRLSIVRVNSPARFV